MVLPVLPGRLPAQHHDQRRVVVLQRADFLLSTHLGLTLVPVTGSNTRQLLSTSGLGSSTACLAQTRVSGYRLQWLD